MLLGNAKTSMDNLEETLKTLCLIKACLNILGLIGNLLSFAVFSRKSFRNASISIYCRALAIFNSFTLLSNIYDIITTTIFLTNLDSPSSSSSSSSSHYFLTTFTRIPLKFIMKSFTPISCWTMVAFSLDQLLLVKYPISSSISASSSNSSSSSVIRRPPSSFFAKPRFKLTIIVVIFALHLVWYIWTTVLYVDMEIVTIDEAFLDEHTNATIISCHPRNLPKSLYIFVLPFLALVVVTLLTLRVLYDSIKTNHSPEIELKLARERVFAINAIALNVLFVALASPAIFSYVFMTGDNVHDYLDIKIASIFFSMYYLFYFGAFFIVNSLFRAEFASMMQCCCTSLVR